MNTALWVIQGLLAAVFLMTGYGKLSSSKKEHIDNGHLKPGDPVAPIRILGILELFGCLGIILPWLTGIAPVLTPVTAVCFCVVMTGALVVHARKKEYKFLPMPVIVIALAAMVAYFRFSSGKPQ